MYAAAADAKSLQLCLTLCNPIDGSPPGSAIPGILQARTLEWVAISFSIWHIYFTIIKKVTSKPSRDSRCVTKFQVISNKLRNKMGQSKV